MSTEIFEPDLDDFQTDLYAFDLLPLNADNFEKLTLATSHHLHIILTNKSTFTLLNKLIAIFGRQTIGRNAIYKDYKNFCVMRSKSEIRQLDYETDLVSKIPTYCPFDGIKIINQKRKLTITELDEQFKNTRVKEAESKAPLLVHVKALENQLKSREWGVISRRLGVDCETSQTLEEIGDVFDVTRERIRQIEKKAFNKIRKKAFWAEVFRAKCNEIFQCFCPVITTSDLIDIDPWFHGFKIDKKGWDVFLKEFSPHLAIIPIGNLTKKHQNTGNLLLLNTSYIDHFKKDLKVVDSSLRNAVSEDVLKSSLQNSKFKHIDMDHYLSILKRFQHDRGKTTGVNIQSIIKKFVDESDKPVSKADTTAHLMGLGLDVNGKRRYIEAALDGQDNVLCIQRNPTLYATLKSIPFSLADAIELCDSYYEFWIKSLPLNYLNHACDTAKWLNKLPRLQKIFKTQWYIVAALNLDPQKRFSTDKLLFWLADEKVNIDWRSFNQIAVEILRIEGRPMSNSQIKGIISKTRALNKYFQLNSSDNVKLIGRGIWEYTD